MKWEAPLSRKAFVAAVVGWTTVEFFLSWAGQGNLPGPDPRGWGDPIPFRAAVAKIPAIFVATVSVGGVYALLSGIRSSEPLDRRTTASSDELPQIPRIQRTVVCPQCVHKFQVARFYGDEFFKCQHCGIGLKYSCRSNLISIAASVTGLAVASIAHVDGLMFMYTWILTMMIIVLLEDLFVARQVEPEQDMPVEFYRSLP